MNDQTNRPPNTTAKTAIIAGSVAAAVAVGVSFFSGPSQEQLIEAARIAARPTPGFMKVRWNNMDAEDHWDNNVRVYKLNEPFDVPIALPRPNTTEALDSNAYLFAVEHDSAVVKRYKARTPEQIAQNEIVADIFLLTKEGRGYRKHKLVGKNRIDDGVHNSTYRNFLNLEYMAKIDSTIDAAKKQRTAPRGRSNAVRRGG